MRIVGVEASEPGGVDTIDVWFSPRCGRWIIERLDAEGSRVGAAYVCDDREDAEECLAEWLRTHDDAHLVAPIEEPRRGSVARAA